MINKMREMAPTIMIVILVTFVIGTIFFNWGMNAGGSKNKLSAAGTINGKEVPLSAFDQQVNAERQKLQENRGEVPPYQYHMVPQQVWEQQVQRVLTQDVIDKLKISATADEVFEYIKNNPLPGIDTASIFQTNGQFDTGKYVKFLNDPSNYDTYPWLRNVEEYTRQSIIPSQKFEKILNAGAIPSRSELQYEYDQTNTKVVFEYAKVNNFMLNVDSLKINDAAIEKYYTAHRDSFMGDNQIELYFAKFPKQPTSNDEKVYLQQLVELKQKILASGKIAENFTEEARIESDDEGSSQNGGDLGLFGKGQMVPEFDTVAFAMDTGKISDPVRTRYGYHLIYVESKELKDGQVKIKARHILKKIVPTIETLDMLSQSADSLRSLISEKGFVQASKSFPGAVLDSTGLFKKGDMIPKIGYISGAGQFAFRNVEKSVVSERLENNDGFYLLTVKQQVKKGILPLASVKEKIVGFLSDSLRKESAKEYILTVKQKLNDNISLSTLKDSDTKIMSGVSDTVPLNGYVPGIGNDTKIAAIASALPIGKVSNPVEFESTYYLIKTLWKKPAVPVDWSSPEIKQVSEQLKMKNVQRMYYGWYTNYKNKSKIKSNIEELYLD
jgi:peptidyl-prolyl cis-trans isomerase D